MEKINKTLTAGILLLLVFVGATAVVIYFYPLSFIGMLPAMFTVYLVEFFFLSNYLESALRGMGRWKAEGRHLSPISAGWQMLWYTKPSTGVKKKIWIMHFMPILAFPILLAEGVVLHFFV